MSDCKCGATWGGKRIEHCTACHETFTGTASGDAHRTGAFHDGTRRCLTPDEMVAKGLVVNPRGQWGHGGMAPEVVERRRNGQNRLPHISESAE